MEKLLKSAEQFLTKLNGFLKGGVSKGIRPEGLTDEVLTQGMKVEAEHSDDPDIQKKIVYDHVAELGPKYYDALAEMEAKLKGENA